MRKLTPEQLHTLFPTLTRKKCELYASHFSAAVEEAQINTRQRLCAFVAQLGHESSDLKYLKEIWGNTSAQVRYDVRTDLGNTPGRDGDGKLYMGRGGIQRTGRKNYLRFKEATGIDVTSHPELLEQPEHAFRSDALFWTDNKLNKLADQLTLRGDAKDLATFDRITKRVNGGYNGRVDRQRRFLVAIAALPEELFQPEPSQSKTDPVNDKPADVSPPQPTDDATAKVLFEKLSKREGAKTVARSAGRRLAEPLGLLTTALAAGNKYAWIGTVAIVAVIAFVIYRERHAIARKLKTLKTTILNYV